MSWYDTLARYAEDPVGHLMGDAADRLQQLPLQENHMSAGPENGPHAQLGVTTLHGFPVGVSGSGEFGFGAGPLGIHALQADLSEGLNRDDATHNTSLGVHAGAHLARFGVQGENGGGEIDVPSLSLDANMDRDHAAVGANANIIGVSGGVHNAEHGIQVGLSGGVGFGGRAYYGDADHDGLRELGGGADIGEYSVDVRTEAVEAAHRRAQAILHHEPLPQTPTPRRRPSAAELAADRRRVEDEAASVPAARQIAATTPRDLRYANHYAD
jgi:hypothetical protein